MNISKKGTVAFMNPSRRCPSAVLIITALFTLAATVCHTVILLTAFDTAVGHYNDTPLSTVLLAIIALAVTVAVVGAIATPKNALPTVWSANLIGDAATRVPMILFIFAGAMALAPFVNSEGGSMINVLLFASGILSAIYFALASSRTKKEIAGTVTALGFAPLVWSMLAVAETYLDNGIAMNSPVKIAVQLGFLSVMLLATAELRFRLGKAAPRLALAFHWLAAFFCIGGGFPVLIASAVGVLTNATYAVYAAAVFAMGVYALIRAVAYVYHPDEGETPAVEIADSEIETPVAETADDVIPDERGE